MNIKQNYYIKFEKIISEIARLEQKPSLLLHCCCAPCASHVLQLLVDYFNITVLFYNPNITEQAEYLYRKNELTRLINDMNYSDKVKILDIQHDSERYLTAAQGYEHLKEGQKRCEICFNLRLEKTAQLAKQQNFDYFTTTLTISPMKNCALLNEIGEQLAEKYNTKWLYSDFKKKEGYKQSIQLSKKYNLYRQNYCGCVFSKRQAEQNETDN